MFKCSGRAGLMAAVWVGILFSAVSFPSHAALGKLLPGIQLGFSGAGAKKCPEMAGSLRIVEPDDGMGAWASYGLPAPTRMLRVMVNDSKCFTVLDRGVGFAAAQAERELAKAGHLREGQNIGAGQMRGADFVLIPDIVSQNANAGGSNFGGHASSGQKRGLMSGMLNAATLGISGKMSSNKQTAQVILTLVDVRTSEQLISVTGDAKITDRAWAAMVNASSVQGSGGVRAGTWENTEIGKVILEAYQQAYADMVAEIRKPRGRVLGRPAQESMVATAAQQPLPAAPSVATSGEAIPVSEQVPARDVQPLAVPIAEEQPKNVGQGAGGAQSAGDTMVLRRTARLLAAASSQSETVAELSVGMLVFPTGNAQGSMLEVEDEMGNKGWVPLAAMAAS